jgi:2-keto-4-pentenoate hydratase/2-oxohepta-3-ene-1,7-dioic acid hydratase in catechol pathway
MQLRQNGEVKQETTLDHQIHKPADVVAFISKYVTLLPGDLIFTGTTGRTQPIKSGDVLEVEIDGIGVLRNPVA